MFICDINVYYRYGKQALEQILEPLPVDMNKLIAILVLDQVPGITQARLNRFFYMDAGNFSKYLKLLEQEDYIYRESDPEDSRMKLCYLTEQSRSLVPTLQSKMDQWEKSCFAGFSEQDRKEYDRLSNKLIQNLSAGIIGDLYE